MNNKLSTPPKKAVVLAAGMGSRLHPLTISQPKPLISFRGKPLIEHSLERLESWGVEEIAVNLHRLSPLLSDYLRERRGSAKLHFSVEPLILGTGGALVPLRRFAGEEPFWLVNADIVWEFDPKIILDAWLKKQPLAAVWLVPGSGPRTVETDAEGCIRTYRSAAPGTPGTATFSGVQLVSPEIYKYLPEKIQRPISLIDVYTSAQNDGCAVIGVTDASGHWNDVGSLRDFLTLAPKGQTLAPRGQTLEHKGQTLAPKGQTLAPKGQTLEYMSPPLPYIAEGKHNEIFMPVLLATDPTLVSAFEALDWPIVGSGFTQFPQRGSDRSFMRVRGDFGSAIFIRYGKERGENKIYARQSRLLHAAGVAVPKLLHHNAVSRCLMMEDAGRDTLEDIIKEGMSDNDKLYRRAIAEMVRFHEIATELAKNENMPLEPAFDRKRYSWEHNLMFKYLLRDRYGLDTRLSAAVLEEYDAVAERLLQTKYPMVIHRDLQSSNIICDGERLIFIDFQGIRIGAVAYDLASLLYDPYVALSAEQRASLLNHYLRVADEDIGRDTAPMLEYAAVQRLTQCLGAYGRLASVGREEWLPYIGTATALLRQAAADAKLPNITGLADDIMAAWFSGEQQNRQKQAKQLTFCEDSCIK